MISPATPPAIEWRDIPDFPEYEVSSDGQIRNKKSKTIRVLEENSRGYLRIRVQRNSTYFRLMVHRCVCKAFIPNPLKKDLVDHIDGNHRNNNVTNLRWATVSENMLNTKLRANKKTKHKNVHQQGKRFCWRIVVNGQIHKSKELFETEDLAYANFLNIVKSLSEFASTPTQL